MESKAPHWNDAKTLKEVVAEAIRGKKTDTPEFKALLRFFGRPKLKKLWEEFLEEERRGKQK